MKYRFKIACLAAFLLFSSAPVSATVSAYTDYYVPYKTIQGQHVCLSKQIMAAQCGIPLASALQGTFSETRTLQQGPTNVSHNYGNINLLANSNALITPQYTFDRFVGGIYEYSFRFDMAALSALNGTNVAGRQKTMNIAKLAVIATVKTAEVTHGKNKFRVWMKFDNLPSFAGLSGLAANVGGSDRPTWPYTSSSSLYRNYLGEMIHADCPD